MLRLYCLEILDCVFRLLTGPDCSQSQCWQELDSDALRYDLEDWLDHFKDDTEGNLGTLARIVICNRKSFEASKESLKASLQLERLIRQRAYRRMEQRRKRDIKNVKILLKAQLRRERATRTDQIRKCKNKYRQVLRRLKRARAGR